MEVYTLKNPHSCNVLITFLLAILPLIISLHTNPASAASSPTQPYNKFLKTSCNTTTYQSLCYKTFLPYASSIKTDPWKLSTTALQTTLSAAGNASKMLSTLAREKSITIRERGVIKDCLENINDSIDEIKQSIKAMSKIRNSSDKEFQMANIRTWLSAARTDEETCTDGFAGAKVSPIMKEKIRGGISLFVKLTSISLSFVNNLRY